VSATTPGRGVDAGASPGSKRNVMRTKNEEQRDQLAHTVVEEVARERGAQGFTIDELVTRFMQVYKMPPVEPSVPRYEATTPLPELGVVVMTSGALYGQTDDGTLGRAMCGQRCCLSARRRRPPLSALHR
jgi:hypothetical protein